MKKLSYLIAVLFLLACVLTPLSMGNDSEKVNTRVWTQYHWSLNDCGGSNGGCYEFPEK